MTRSLLSQVESIAPAPELAPTAGLKLNVLKDGDCVFFSAAADGAAAVAGGTLKLNGDDVADVDVVDGPKGDDCPKS